MTLTHLRPLAAAVALLLSAPACRAIDLLGSFEAARGADPSQRAAEQALAAGREKRVLGDAQLLPRVNLSISASRMDERTSADGTALPPPLDQLVRDHTNGNARDVTLQLNQPVYDAKASADKKQLHVQADMAETRYRGARQDLAQRVGETYFGVLLADEGLRVVRAELAAVRMQRDRAQARFDVGRGKVTDLQEAQARVDSVAAREASAQSTLALRQAQFRELTGTPASGLAPLAAQFTPRPPQPEALADWQRLGDARSIQVVLRRQEAQIAAAEAGKHSLAARPTLELVGRYTQRNQDGSQVSALSPDMRRNATLSLQFTLPLFAGGALDARQRESLAKQREADEQLEAARRDMRLQVQDGYLAVSTGVTRIAALVQSLASARTALQATTLGRDLGTRTELDVLDAQQRVFQVELDLAQARHDYLLGRLRLANAAGAVPEDELRNLNTYLEL